MILMKGSLKSIFKEESDFSTTLAQKEQLNSCDPAIGQQRWLEG